MVVTRLFQRIIDVAAVSTTVPGFFCWDGTHTARHDACANGAVRRARELELAQLAALLAADRVGFSAADWLRVVCIESRLLIASIRAAWKPRLGAR